MLFSVFACFVIAILSLVIILASLGKSLGLRRFYISVLLRIFEFGKRRILSYEEAERSRHDDGSGDEGFSDMDAEPDSSPDNESDVSEDSNLLIRRDISISAIEGVKIPSKRKDYDLNWKKDFHVSDLMYFAKCGAEAIIQDEVTQRFSAEELRSWNLLTRTDRGYHFISVRLTILWCLGCFVRYCILVPFRVMVIGIGISWLVISTFLIGYFPDGKFKKQLNRVASLMAHRILCRAMSAVVTFHNVENRATTGICVANHTSPLDVIILSSDNCYAMVGQAHGGFLGLMQRALSRATAHIWFERSEVKDRHLVSRRLREHVEDEHKLPILIFPEGTCVNNTSVMMFKKGGFEVSPVVYPVAIKYDPKFGDVFWNSSIEGMLMHIYRLATSWAIVAEIWYLPPIRRMEDEDSVEFASRVKSEIAHQGGLVDLDWDGQLKRMKAKEIWKSKSQRDYSRLLKLDNL